MDDKKAIKKMNNINYDKPILRNVNYYINTLGGNCLMGITGMPMTGKSHFAVKMAVDWTGGNIKLEDCIVYTVRDLLDKTFKLIKVDGKPLSLKTFSNHDNIEEWLELHKDTIVLPKGKVMIFDEAGTGVYVREFFSQDNKTMSKILQVWRFLNMFIMIVVPGDMRLADSTISRFMNIEVKMKKITKGQHALAFANEYTGWDNKRNQPRKARLIGNRYAGGVKVKMLKEPWFSQYEQMVQVQKLRVLSDLGSAYSIQEREAVAKSRRVEDDIEYIKNNPEKYTNSRGNFDAILIENGLQLTHRKALYISKILANKVNTHVYKHNNELSAEKSNIYPDKLTTPKEVEQRAL